MAEHDLHPIDEAQAEHGRALVQAAGAQTRAPLGLRERIEAQRAPARRRRFVLGGSFAAVAAAAVLALVLISTGGSPAGPTVAQAGQLARLAPTGPAPQVDPSDPGLLKRSVEGVTYPSWQNQFPWHASGVREDRLRGRRAVTVYYRNPENVRIGYTIVGGDPLDEPPGRALRHGSERYVTVERGSRRLVTWRRGGHTCVISAPDSVPRERLLALASWSGAGPGEQS
jgi:hypothetical protein